MSFVIKIEKYQVPVVLVTIESDIVQCQSALTNAVSHHLFCEYLRENEIISKYHFSQLLRGLQKGSSKERNIFKKPCYTAPFQRNSVTRFVTPLLLAETHFQRGSWTTSWFSKFIYCKVQNLCGRIDLIFIFILH